MKLALLVLILLAILSVREHRPQNVGLPLVHADYPVCVTVRNGPIQKNKPQMTYQSQRGTA